MAAANSVVTAEVTAIKYYLDELELKDPCRYAADYSRPGPAILGLITLYNTLRRTYVYFRLHVPRDIEGGCELLPVGAILFNFFTKRVYTGEREFQEGFPRLAQMIAVASGDLAGGEMTSLNITA